MQAALSWFFKLLFEWLFAKAWRAGAAYVASKKVEKIEEKNEESLKNALQTGDLNEIGKAGGNLLNGTEPK